MRTGLDAGSVLAVVRPGDLPCAVGGSKAGQDADKERGAIRDSGRSGVRPWRGRRRFADFVAVFGTGRRGHWGSGIRAGFGELEDNDRSDFAQRPGPDCGSLGSPCNRLVLQLSHGTYRSYRGGLVGASVGFAFLDWRRMAVLAVSGSAGFAAGLLTGGLLRYSFPVVRGGG